MPPPRPSRTTGLPRGAACWSSSRCIGRAPERFSRGRGLDRLREAGRWGSAARPPAPSQPPQVEDVASSVLENASLALLISSELLLIASISLSSASSCLLLA